MYFVNTVPKLQRVCDATRSEVSVTQSVRDNVLQHRSSYSNFARLSIRDPILFSKIRMLWPLSAAHYDTNHS